MATELIPERATLDALRAAAAGCRACPLWQGTTQTVFGEGLRRSRVVLVGEQPGDQEDRQGHPFVGPAGRELDGALEAELEVVAPELVVCLGATSAKALLGSGFRVTRDSGVVLESKLGYPALGTIHPSAILRAPDNDARRTQRRRLQDDLRVVAELLRE